MALVHPIFKVLIRRPELVIDHIGGYAALAQQEASTLGGDMLRRAIAWGVAAAAFMVFLMLVGVAVMLGFTLGEFHWVLVLAPGATLALALVAMTLARRSLPTQAFVELRGQLEADAQALRMAGADS